VTTLHTQIDHLLETRRTAVARRLLDQSFSENPDDPENHFYAARIASLEGDSHAAERHVGDLLLREPGHIGGRSLAVELARKSKNYALAEEHALDLIRDNPEVGHFYAQYAHVMLETLHLEKARALTLEARRLSPDDRLAHVLDVLTSIVLGERGQAREDLATLVASDPDALPTAWTLLAVLEAEHREWEAFEVAQEIVRAEPDDPDAVNAVIELRARTHLLALPAWPLRRFGNVGAIGLWVVMAVGLAVASATAYDGLGAWIGAVWLVYVIYSWTYLPLLRRLIRARGI
jgi:tetratricopeptide (TPR) repeat protein